MARHFTPEYVERATLRDGTRVLLRLLTPEDKPLLRREFERWSPESRYARFLSPKEHLTDSELAYLCEIDQEHHFALGALTEVGDGHGEPDALGIARFIRLGDSSVAEPAIAVADRAQGRGLGRLLFLRLCAAAAERGIEQFTCEVLCENHAMQKLIGELAPNRTISVAQGVTTIHFDLAAFAPDVPHEATKPEQPMYALFRAAAQNVVEWTERVRRLWRQP